MLPANSRRIGIRGKLRENVGFFTGSWRWGKCRARLRKRTPDVQNEHGGPKNETEAAENGRRDAGKVFEDEKTDAECAKNGCRTMEKEAETAENELPHAENDREVGKNEHRTFEK